MSTHQNFGLQTAPFSDAPEPRFFCRVSAHLEALATLQYTVVASKACAAVIGPSGAGKTLLARIIAANANQNTTVLWLHGLGQPHANTEINVYQPGALCQDVPQRATKRTTLAKWTRAGYTQNQAPLLIIDNADALPPHAWRDVMALISREVQFPKPVNIIILGLPSTLKILAHPRLVRLRRRIFRIATLGGLTFDETNHYMRARLRTAGGDLAQCFTEEAVAQIHRLTRGNPGLINQVAENAMIEACGNDRQRVGVIDVVNAVRAIVGAQPHQPLNANNRLPAPAETDTDTPPNTRNNQNRTTPNQKTTGSKTQRKHAESFPARFADQIRTRPAVKPVKATTKSVDRSKFTATRPGGIEQRLGFLEGRLAQALTAVRQARSRYNPPTDHEQNDHTTNAHTEHVDSAPKRPTDQNPQPEITTATPT